MQTPRTFPGGRMPLADEASESARTADYWAWLAARSGEVGHPDPIAASDPAWGCGTWVCVTSAGEADFEALHMQHSIGHRWDKYSGLGQIFSLRSEAGLPVVTILVADGCVVHAREERNIRLSAENQDDLMAFAACRGWTVKDESNPFDILPNGSGENTRLTYLLRGAGANSGQNILGTAVFAGRATPDELGVLSGNLESGRYFQPSAVGLDGLGADADGNGWHEVQSVRFVSDEPTADMDTAGLSDAWLAMASSFPPAASRTPAAAWAR